MDLKLIRKDCKEDGIFGVLLDEQGNQIAVTAEHAYNALPKLPQGVYTCKRGHHVLHSGPVETFEVLDVPGHSGILLHVGNYPQKDSDGCILLGEERVGDMITNSRETFEKFLQLQSGVDSFMLTVE